MRQKIVRKSAAVLLGLLLFTLGVLADDWPAATVQNVFSDNGRNFVRILPGQSVGDSVGFSSAPKGRWAHAEFYARRANRSYELVADSVLENPVSPTDALVTNSGYLVTFDNWHNLGYGQAVAIYGPTGRLIQAYTLEQLYPPDQLGKIPRSISSRWWRCAPHGYVDPDKQTEIYVFEHLGGTFTFKVESGAFAYHPGQAACTAPKGPFSASWFGQ